MKNYNLEDTIEVTEDDLRIIQRAALKEKIVDLMTESAKYQADTPLWMDRELERLFAENDITEEELDEIHQRVDKNVEEMERQIEQFLNDNEGFSEVWSS